MSRVYTPKPSQATVSPRRQRLCAALLDCLIPYFPIVLNQRTCRELATQVGCQAFEVPWLMDELYSAGQISMRMIGNQAIVERGRA